MRLKGKNVFSAKSTKKASDCSKHPKTPKMSAHKRIEAMAELLSLVYVENLQKERAMCEIKTKFLSHSNDSRKYMGRRVIFENSKQNNVTFQHNIETSLKKTINQSASLEIRVILLFYKGDLLGKDGSFLCLKMNSSREYLSFHRTEPYCT